MSNKRRLLFVNSHMKIGGGEKSLLDLLQHMDYSQYDVDLLLIEGKGDYFRLIPSEVNIKYVDLTQAYGPIFHTIVANIRKWKLGFAWYRIISFLSGMFGKKLLRLASPVFHLHDHYDCVISYRPGPCADVATFIVNANKKICWWHNGKCDYSEQQIADVDTTWKYMDYVVAVSEGAKKLISDHFTFPNDKILVIPNMIDINVVQSLAGNSSPYNDSAAARIITVCRISPEKHLENIIYAMSHLQLSENKKIRWYIVGDGPERDNLNSLIVENGLSDEVILLGEQVNPYPYVKFSDYYVNTSYQESQSISVIEAMTLHVPCVVTRTLGTDGYCKDGVNCIVAEQTKESLLHAVKEMLKKKDIVFLTDNAFQTVNQEFSSNVIVSKVLSIL